MFDTVYTTAGLREHCEWPDMRTAAPTLQVTGDSFHDVTQHMVRLAYSNATNEAIHARLPLATNACGLDARFTLAARLSEYCTIDMTGKGSQAVDALH
jgi:hypothetical protein